MYPSIELTTAQMIKYKIKPELGHGGYGKVFDFDDGRVIKIWTKESLLDYISPHFGLSCENIAFGQAFAKYKNEYVAHIMQKFPGKSIFEYNNVDYYNFINALRRTYRDTRYTSANGIRFWECTKKNVFYWENNYLGRLSLLDTDFWYRLKESYEKILKLNLKDINDSILESFVCLNSFKLKDFAYHEAGLENIWLAQDLVTYLEKLRVEVERYTNKKIKKLKDFDKLLR